MELSIIVVSHNTMHVTRDCLESILHSKIQLEYELIVVDNASSDGSVEMIELDFPEVYLLKNSTNLMFAKANNQAMKIARGAYFLILNSDTIVESGNIEMLYDFIHRNREKVACVGPRVLNDDRSIQSEGYCHESVRKAVCSAFGVMYWPVSIRWKRKVLPPGYVSFEVGATRQVGWCSGACMMINSEAAEKAGGFDEDFYFYHEEVEWCYRVRQLGYEVWVLPMSGIVHLGGASVNGKIAKSIGNKLLQQRMLYYKKTYGIGVAFLENLTEILCYSMSATICLVSGRKQKYHEYANMIKTAIFRLSYIVEDLLSNM
ncbi:MAG: glycosyltransferase family 2 protein [Syntrophobacteraceae bacterium]|nr:glycosyltransferase family 2 protein [Syntrophobacteraceae bacterium]